MDSKEKEIKEFALKSGAWKVGIASAEAISKVAVPGRDPQTVLPNSRSVIVVAGPFASKGSWRSPNLQVLVTNKLFDGRMVAMKVARYIESSYNKYAIFYDGVPGTGNMPYLDMEICAELAGLGTRGLNGRILNKDHGILLLGCVVTDLELSPDGPMPDPVCPHPECVEMWSKEGTTPCLKMCPNSLSGAIENGKIKWMEYIPHVSDRRVEMDTVARAQNILSEIVSESDPEKRKMMTFGTNFNRVIRSLARGVELEQQCFDCLRVCPVVIEANELTPKNLDPS